MLRRELDIIKTRKDFKRVAGIYNFWSRLTESKATDIALEISNLQDRQDVLEVACGTGVVFESIINQNPNGQNTGIDLSTDMLARAKKRLTKYDSSHFQLEEGNALNLAFPDKTFNVLFNNYMVDLMPEESFDQIASEYFRVLKAGGVAIVTTFSFGYKPVHKFWYWTAKNFPGLLTGCRPVNFKTNLVHAGFTIEKNVQVSQNTFPSEVIKAKKPII